MVVVGVVRYPPTRRPPGRRPRSGAGPRGGDGRCTRRTGVSPSDSPPGLSCRRGRGRRPPRSNRTGGTPPCGPCESSLPRSDEPLIGSSPRLPAASRIGVTPPLWHRRVGETRHSIQGRASRARASPAVAGNPIRPPVAGLCACGAVPRRSAHRRGRARGRSSDGDARGSLRRASGATGADPPAPRCGGQPSSTGHAIHSGGTCRSAPCLLVPHHVDASS
jgi:hypothetical protein